MVKARREINHMNITANRSRIELIIGSVATIVSGWMCVYASLSAPELYPYDFGDNASRHTITDIALSSYIWSPILLTVVLLVFLRTVTRKPENRKVFGALVFVNFAVLLFVTAGFLAPFLGALGMMQQ